MKKTYLDLSTGHLSRDTMNTLDAAVAYPDLPHGWPAMSLAKYPHGYFITVPAVNDPDVWQQMNSLPRDLHNCLMQAASEGAELIRFDSDGDIDGDLPYHQED